ncbi:MAG TPA: sigma-54 dependent transcriptional regulator [Pyrinomonadaceae bacterium]|nr:sigma-54 dependent transcriptional regulator [Pyrinomonadaceae bacterium]
MLSARILIVDDEASVGDALALVLGERGHEVRTAASAAQASKALEGEAFDLVFTDLMLPDATGMDVLARVKERSADAEVILMTGHGSLDIAIEAVKRGAFYYLDKPFTAHHVLMLAERALQCAAMRRENRVLRATIPAVEEDFGIIGQHRRVRQIHQLIHTAAPSDASVLIEGESGTGKELIARAVHLRSARSEQPFVSINCAAIPSELAESELFGYKRGAFTGADRDKRGLIEAASGGTLFLDEVAEMPPHLQTKLLRVLQERRLRRLGDEREREVDFRLISSTNRDTGQMILDGTLRKDLYFRISTVKIRVLPMRERLEDLAPLCEHFLRRYAEKYGKNIRGVSRAAYACLASYDWPGNVRELESVVEHAVIFAQEGQLAPEDLPGQFHDAQGTHTHYVIPPHLTMEEIERAAIAQTLERTGGNVRKAAQLLDFHRPRFYRKLKKYGLLKRADLQDTFDDAFRQEAAAEVL